MKSFWKHSGDLAGRISGGRLLVTLDFDGTLAALAETPRQARLKPEFRAALVELAASPGVYVFILSGRELKNVRKLAGIKNLYYGGNHGIEIRGPRFSWRDAAAARASRSVRELAADLRERFPEGTGVLVEDKIFSASVHYRALKPQYKNGFFSRLKALHSPGDAGFVWRRGHKVFEVLPRGASHKGTAAGRLAKELGATLALAVGDDLTDEDMFREFARRGITVRVGRKPGSKAQFFIENQAEVLRLLRFITASRRHNETTG